MKKQIFLFIKYYLFWILYFVIFKAIFLIVNSQATGTLTTVEIRDVFLFGLKMDISAAGYLSLIPGIVIAMSPLIGKVTIKILKIYTLVLVILMTILGLADMSLYPAWGTRIDSQVIPYLTDPIAVVSSVSTLQLILSIAAMATITAIFYAIFKKAVVNTNIDVEARWYKVTPVLLLLTAMLILPIRGGIGNATLNFSSVYFSQKTFANHAAYNYFWSFCYALTHNEYDKSPVNYMSNEEAEATINEHIKSNTDSIGARQIVESNGKPVNVVLVILESFSNKVIYPLAKENAKYDAEHGIEQKYFDEKNQIIKTLAPNLSKYYEEGVSFTNCIATGTRSDRGISALLGGFPAIIRASSILGFPEKMKSVTFLPKIFGEKGYELSFYYGGDIDFYNTNVMLIQSGIEKVTARSSFPASENMIQKWGTPDEYLYSALGKDIKQMKKPYMTIVYNISSHEPFDVPKHFSRIKGASASDKYLNSVAYTDSCLGKFIEDLKKSPDWSNTLVIITSDHTSLLPNQVSSVYELASYRVPMIWTGGVVKKHEVIRKICSQTDLYSTLLQQLGMPEKTPKQINAYSHNMFARENEFAFFFRPDGWGFVTPEIAYYTNIDNNQVDYIYNKITDKSVSDSIGHFAKAYTQYLHNDFIKR